MLLSILNNILMSPIHCPLETTHASNRFPAFNDPIVENNLKLRISILFRSDFYLLHLLDIQHID